MADRKFHPVCHDHKALAYFEKAAKWRGSGDADDAHDALEVECALANEMLAARARAGLTQEAVAVRMGTTKSAISRLEGAGKHAPSVASLKRYAAAVGCTLRIELVPAAPKGRRASQPGTAEGAARQDPPVPL